MGVAGEIFVLAAHRLQAAAGAPDSQGAVERLLERLDYARPDPRELGNRLAILHAAAFVSGMFVADSPDAPGAAVFCGTAAPRLLGAGYAQFEAVGVAGSGRSAGRAFERCVGEAVEYLSQLSPPDDPLPGTAAQLAWVPDMAHQEEELQISAVALHTGQRLGVPARLCLRRPGDVGAFAGAGCAAGRTWTEAVSGGLWELIERDAVTAWWHEGRAPRPLPVAAERSAAAYLGHLRGPARNRRTHFLDISKRAGLPAVAACSLARGGGCFAVGFAAHLDIAEAARKAVRELVQMELGLHFVAAKEAARLSAHERRQLQRAEQVGEDHPALRASGRPAGHAPVTPELSPEDLLAATLERLSTASIGVYAADITRACLGIPVASVIAPALSSIPDEAAWAAANPARNIPLF